MTTPKGWRSLKVVRMWSCGGYEVGWVGDGKVEVRPNQEDGMRLGVRGE